MWLPVIDDSTSSQTLPVDEHVMEAIVEIVPEMVLRQARVEFVWIRSLPSNPPPDKLAVAFRHQAAAEDQLAALVHDNKGVVLELYLENIQSALTDEWLQLEWAIHPHALNLTSTEKLEITIFALLVHVSIRHGLAEEAKQLVRRIGRVIFRAAVRAAMKRLQATHPQLAIDRITPSRRNSLQTPRGPIKASEVAGVDYDRLFRELLGLEPAEDGTNSSDSSPDDGS